MNINLSPSAINLYFTSPLLYYFKYLEKRAPDTEVPTFYGEEGSLVHSCIEKSLIEKNICSKEAFILLWQEKKLHEKKDIKGNVLDVEIYYQCYVQALGLVPKDITFHIEQTLQFPLISYGEMYFFTKGVIDVYGIDSQGHYYIFDWKTDNRVPEGNKHALQGKHYAYLLYKQHEKVVKSVTFYYLKLGEKREYTFSEADLLSWENQLQRFAYNIAQMGMQIEQYDFGGCFDYLFNEYQKACHLEKARRESTQRIAITIRNNGLSFPFLPEKLAAIINKKYSYDIPNAKFMPAYRQGWDGKKYFFKHGTLPYAFLDDVLTLIREFNEYYKTTYAVDIVDCRNQAKVQRENAAITFADGKRALRDYQEEAVLVALRKKVGILNLGTGAGKTVVAAEIIRRTKRKTLFLVNRIELVTQTIDVFKDELGVRVGRMVEGELDVEPLIVVSTVQTICAILDRKDNTTDSLIKACEEFSLVIFDECHGISNVGMYGRVAAVMPHLAYAIGLTGTAWKNDGSTLEMNALVGFPIYKKSTQELEEEGYLTPTTAIFLKQPKLSSMQLSGEYADEYRTLIVHNTNRNNACKYLVDKFRSQKKILVLTKAVEHAKLLGELIPRSGVIVGETNPDVRKELFAQFKKEKDMVLVGSMKIFGTGIDIPDLDVIINMSGHKSGTDSIQIIGRVKRLAENKQMSYFIDFDDQTSFFYTAAKERKQIIRQFGNKVIEMEKITEIQLS